MISIKRVVKDESELNPVCPVCEMPDQMFYFTNRKGFQINLILNYILQSYNNTTKNVFNVLAFLNYTFSNLNTVKIWLRCADPFRRYREKST